MAPSTADADGGGGGSEAEKHRLRHRRAPTDYLSLRACVYVCICGYMRYTRACGHIRESSAARFLLVTVTVSRVSQLTCVTVSYV